MHITLEYGYNIARARNNNNEVRFESAGDDTTRVVMISLSLIPSQIAVLKSPGRLAITCWIEPLAR